MMHIFFLNNAVFEYQQMSNNPNEIWPGSQIVAVMMF